MVLDRVEIDGIGSRERVFAGGDVRTTHGVEFIDRNHCNEWPHRQSGNHFHDVEHRDEREYGWYGHHQWSDGNLVYFTVELIDDDGWANGDEHLCVVFDYVEHGIIEHQQWK